MFVASQLRTVFRQQETRVALYSEFEQAYQDYGEGKCDPSQYQSICVIVTQGFQEASASIQEAEQGLRDAGREDIARDIRHLQELEKQKLFKTVRIQMLEIESAEQEKDFTEEIRALKESLPSLRDEINEALRTMREEYSDLLLDQGTSTPAFHEDSKPFFTEVERQGSDTSSKDQFLMQDAEGGRTEVVEQSKGFSLLKAYGKLGISLAINIGLPIAIYYILKPYLAPIWALLISGVPPILMVIFTLIRTKKIDVIGVIAIVAFVLSAILALVDGDARLLLLRDSVVTCIIGLMFLLSMIPVRLRSVPWQKRPEFGEYAFEMCPLVFSTGKQMFPVPPIVHPDGREEPAMDYYWRSFAIFRRNLRIVTAIWGCGLISEFIVKVILIEDQSVSLDQIILIGNILVACIVVISFTITVLVSRRNMKNVKREMEAARAH